MLNKVEWFVNHLSDISSNEEEPFPDEDSDNELPLGSSDSEGSFRTYSPKNIYPVLITKIQRKMIQLN